MIRYALCLAGLILVPLPAAAADHVAHGTFEVSTKPVAGADPSISSLILSKTFQGDLKGASVGEMLGYRTSRPGSAGYVAIERVTGDLSGKHGTFVLQHSGTMHGGALYQQVGVLPDSGTDALLGIAGTMTIETQGDEHHYTFTYTLPN